jgi:hypothetical protein
MNSKKRQNCQLLEDAYEGTQAELVSNLDEVEIPARGDRKSKTGL